MPPIDQDYIFENMRQRRMLSLISRGQFFGTPVKGGIRRNSLQSTVFPEYPDANLTEGVQNYGSSIDPGITNLNARYYFPENATNLPMLTCIHGFEQEAIAIGEDTLRRFARLGYFVVAVEMRGSTGSGGNSGNRDASGREKQDVYDAEESIKSNFAANLADGVQGIWGMSGGGIVMWNMVQAYPDRYIAGISYFGISDYGVWYTEAPPRQTPLESYIGGDPVAVPDEYNTRNARLRLSNILCHVSFCHDTEDTSVDVSHSQAMRDLYVLAGRTDYYYNESTIGSPFRWEHASPDTEPDLIEFEQYWKNRPKTGAVNTVPTSGTLQIPGHLHTKRFQVWMNDGNYLNAGRSRYGTVAYNTEENTYEVTNDSTLDAVVTVVTSDGLVGVAALAAGTSTVITPVSLSVDGDTPIMWFVAGIGVLNDGSGNCKIWVDKTGGPQHQGYSFRASGNLPGILATDINSLPAIEFVAAGTEGLQSERRRDLQGVANYTLISVTTGAYIGQAQSSNNHIQQALSSGSYFNVNANGGAGFGSHAGSATYLVRTILYDGSQGTNATRLVVRQNKIAQSLSFTGTIPATTEAQSATVFRLGRRAYDGLYIGGKIAEFMIFAKTLSDPADKEDLLKTKYAI